MKVVVAVGIALGSLVLLAGCSEDDTSSGNAPLGDSGTGGSAQAAGGADGTGGTQAAGGTQANGGAAPASGGAPAPDAGPPLDCTADNWSGLSETCWSCLCGACPEKLGLCNSDCTDILECAFEKNTFVNVAGDLPCEVSATAVECLTTPATQAQAGPLIQFDLCLISGGAAAGSFRVCDAECEIPYSGDVCTRYPQPPSP